MSSSRASAPHSTRAPAVLSAKPMIMVNTLGYGNAEGTRGAMTATMIPSFSKILVDEVLPQVEKNYNVAKDRSHRAIAGLAYVDGKFYYHAWPEVYLREWVAVDPTFGQFPADAAHLRFIVGGLGRQTELLRLMGNLKIDVVSVNGVTKK